jgi:hypothetical protein
MRKSRGSTLGSTIEKGIVNTQTGDGAGLGREVEVMGIQYGEGGCGHVCFVGGRRMSRTLSRSKSRRNGPDKEDKAVMIQRQGKDMRATVQKKKWVARMLVLKQRGGVSCAVACQGRERGKANPIETKKAAERWQERAS